MAVTYQDLYIDSRKLLKAKGIEAYQLEARELLSAASGKSREDLVRDMPLYASDQVVQQLKELLRRRLMGEPIAYIIGQWDFYGLTLEINRHVLIPRRDTEVLAARGIELAKQVPGGARILDLCAGSGCVGLAIAARSPHCRAVLVEKSQEALQVCKKNIRRLNLTGRVTFFQGDALGRPDPAWGRFHVLACNPPYIPSQDIPNLDGSVRDFEPHDALDGGADGLDFYRAVSEGWKSVLRPGGALLFEVGVDQAIDVAKLLASTGYEQIMLYKDSGGILRVVEGRVPQGPLEEEEQNG